VIKAEQASFRGGLLLSLSPIPKCLGLGRVGGRVFA